MKRPSLYFALVFFGTIASVSAECPANEEYSDCGSGCPKTCEGDNTPVCAAVCVKGCFCKEGFLRNKQGLCLPLDQCQQTECPANEEYSNCGSGCPKTCEGDNTPVCAAVCVKGCFCKEGFLRNKQGLCLPLDQCQQNNVCPHNEEFSDCASPCPPRCGDEVEKRACAAVCLKECVCKGNLVRNKQGLCIPRSQCPSTSERCPVNEVFQNGGPVCENCGPTCLAISDEAKCYCKPGYSRCLGFCIPNENCPRQPVDRCPVNEVFSRYGPLCEGCRPRCLGICYETKCYCRPGFSRFQGVCIPNGRCPRVPVPTNTCPVNEEYGCIDPPGCRTCQNEYPCPTLVCNPGCSCKNGFLRYQGICIPKYACPRRWNYYYR